MTNPATTLPPAADRLSELYEADETAWLEEMSRLVYEGRLAELDYRNLASYLEDMAGSQRREIESRLTTLIAHLLKWEHQPKKRSKSWKLTILRDRRELDIAFTRVLRRHAEETLGKCYARAVREAEVETSLPKKTFPVECPYTLDWILTEELF